MSSDRSQTVQNRNEQVACASCGHFNPGENNFCGHCGQPLAHATESPGLAAAEPSPQQTPSFAEIFGLESRSQRQSGEQTTISGPSFLGLGNDGLGDDPAAGPDFGYEKEASSHAGRWLALFVVIALAAVGVAQWKPIRNSVLHYLPQLQAYLQQRQTRANSARAEQPQAPPSQAATEQNPVSSTPTQPASPEPARASDPSADSKTGTTPAPEPANAQAKNPPAKEEEASSESAQTPAQSTEREPAPKTRQKNTAKTSRYGKSPQASRKLQRSRRVEPAKPAQSPDNSLVLAGEKYLYGRGARRNCEQALVYFRTAAQAQNPRAMSHLGTMYATGTCVRQDRVQAYRWLSQALAGESNNHFLEQNLTMLWRQMTPAEKRVVLTRSR